MGIEEMAQLAAKAKLEGTQDAFIDLVLRWAGVVDERITEMMRLLHALEREHDRGTAFFSDELLEAVRDATTVTGTLNLREMGQALG